MTLTFLQAATDTTDTDAYTFSAQNLGTEDAGRYIIVSAVARKAGAGFTLSSLSVGGVSATIVKQVTNSVTNSDTASISIAAVPTGATGDIVVTWSTTVLRCAIGVWSAVDIDSSTASASESSTAADPTCSLAIPAGGFAIGAGLTAAASTAAWTGLTEKFDSTLESFVTYTGASDEFVGEETGLTITIDFGSSTESAGVFASWAPAAAATGRNLASGRSLSSSRGLASGRGTASSRRSV